MPTATRSIRIALASSSHRHRPSRSIRGRATRPLLRIAARSYWHKRWVSTGRPGWQPSVAKRKLAGLRRSIRKATDSLRGFPDPLFSFLEETVGRERLARYLEDTDAIMAALEGVEDVNGWPLKTQTCSSGSTALRAFRSSS